MLRKNTIITLYAIFILLISSCTPVPSERIINQSAPADADHDGNPEQRYRIIEATDNDAALCSSNFNAYKENGFMMGIRVILKDEATGQDIQGNVNMRIADNSGSVGSQGYTCFEGIYAEHFYVVATSPSHAPVAVRIPVQQDKLLTLEVMLPMSCSGGPSFYDNELVLSGLDEDDPLNKLDIRSSIEQLESMVFQRFGLNLSEASIGCLEAELGRGGFVMGRGNQGPGKKFELHYQWAWCSSSGANCGNAKCFSSDSTELFSAAKELICSGLYSYQQKDDIYMQDESDNTSLVQEGCFDGDYDRTDGSKKMISVIQNSNRGSSSVSIGAIDCMVE